MSEYSFTPKHTGVIFESVPFTVNGERWQRNLGKTIETRLEDTRYFWSVERLSDGESYTSDDTYEWPTQASAAAGRHIQKMRRASTRKH